MGKLPPCATGLGARLRQSEGWPDADLALAACAVKARRPGLLSNLQEPGGVQARLDALDVGELDCGGERFGPVESKETLPI
jgi:hypothetical protein